MRKGKMSSIRMRSNKMFNYYDKNGNIKLEKLNKKERKKYIELKKNEQESLEEKNRLPKIRKMINGKWTIL
jgi:hypothetical protein